MQMKISNVKKIYPSILETNEKIIELSHRQTKEKIKKKNYIFVFSSYFFAYFLFDKFSIINSLPQDIIKGWKIFLDIQSAKNFNLFFDFVPIIIYRPVF